jgi:class 3 adenylate cyclase
MTLPNPCASLRQPWDERLAAKAISPEQYYTGLAREAISHGELLFGVETAREGLDKLGPLPALRQQLALALVQMGAIAPALTELKAMESGQDEETLCLLGRVYKELWRRKTDPDAAAEALRQCLHYYRAAFVRYHTYYPGINLAHALTLAGHRAEAESCAREVQDLLRPQLATQGEGGQGWLLATAAESALYLNQLPAAREAYRQAARLLAGRWRDLSSMRRQAREVLRQQGGDANALDDCFELPSVVIFTGHMLDRPGRKTPRFPAGNEPEIRRQIVQQLELHSAGLGYSSGACGADILFCEAMLARGGKIHLVLPCPAEAFKRLSVNFAGADWARRFDEVLERASSCCIANPGEAAASETKPISPVSFLYANRIITGLALLQARALDLELRTLAVWDGRPGDGLGGTSSTVAEWTARQLPPVIINPSAPKPSPVPPTPAALKPPAWGLNIGAMQQDIKAVLFADVAGYSRMGEDQMFPFMKEFMGRASRLIADSPQPPIIVQTWGDAIYCAFDEMRAAAAFALDLRDLVAQTPWQQHGLPGDLGIRIALHAGPVFVCLNPVTRQFSITGSHVTRAARIEPVTAKGQVFTSQEFAALCEVQNVPGLVFEYLGQVPTAKKYGTAPLYRLDRSQPETVIPQSKT